MGGCCCDLGAIIRFLRRKCRIFKLRFVHHPIVQFMGRFLHPIVQFMVAQYFRFIHPIVEFLIDLYSRFLSPIVNSTLFLFLWSIVEFFLPISVTSLFLWFILRPNHVLPRVDAAVLLKFGLGNATSSSAALLDYDMAVDISIHNAHNYFDARYLDLTAVASYAGARLGPTVDVLPVFVQRPNTTNVVHAVFQGSGVHLPPPAAQVFAREAADGSFNVLVTVASTFMYNFLFKKPVYYYNHECYLTFPAPHGPPAGATVLTLGTLCSATAR